jgi:hypothetical protein
MDTGIHLLTTNGITFSTLLLELGSDAALGFTGQGEFMSVSVWKNNPKKGF